MITVHIEYGGAVAETIAVIANIIWCFIASTVELRNISPVRIGMYINHQTIP